MKTCTECLVEKPLEDFPRHKPSKDGRHTKCLVCRRAQNRAHYYANKDQYRERDASRDWHSATLKKYSLSAEEYLTILESQGGVCAICGASPSEIRLAVDHDHATGKVRGLLCTKCNLGLGYFQDNVESIRQAIAYLQ